MLDNMTFSLKGRVVISPNLSSADAMKRLMGCWRVQAQLSIQYAKPHWMMLWRGILSSWVIPHLICSLSKYSMHCPDNCHWLIWELTSDSWLKKLTLIARVWTMVMTSKDPPRTWLADSWGSFSHIAVIVSTAAILVICDMMSISARLITCLRQLGNNNKDEL